MTGEQRSRNSDGGNYVKSKRKKLLGRESLKHNNLEVSRDHVS